jgi:iron complex outermembrane receptor protein
MKKKKYLCMAIACVLAAGATTSFAEEGPQKTTVETKQKTKAIIDDYALDEVVITAMRSEKKDTDVPAATIVITAKQIKASGAKNAAEALSKVNGLTYKSFGPMAASMGSMINEINIRGNGNGTLVLINGNPVSWRGKYNIDAIPAESIERIEIVKGGGSVLYGSDAMGGTVNIITKKGAALNQVSNGFGNYGQQSYNLNVGDEQFSVNYSLDRWRKFEGISESDVNSTKFNGSTRTDIKDIEKENIGFNWNINDQWNVLYNNYQTKATYNRYVDRVDHTTSGISNGDMFNGRTYTTDQHVSQIHFHDGDWKASAYFNTGTVESKGPTYISSTGARTPNGWYNTREKNITYGMDVQKSWHVSDKVNAIIGMDLQRENYQYLYTPQNATYNDYFRNNWGIFGQWEQAFDKNNTGIFSARETWTSAAAGDNNYNNFSMAGQFIHKLDKNNSVYMSIGQSFIMPTFAQMYGASDTAIPNPGLKPQTGVNYEIGWKKNADRHNWKAALFHTDIKDNISAIWNKNKAAYTYSNEDFKNTGVELSCDITGENGFSYNWGVTWQDPQSKSTKKDYWDRMFGRLQLTGGVTYKKEKWLSSLTGSYLSGRVQTPSSEHSFATKPYFLTTLNTTYSPDAANEITLTIDNILNREDNLSHSSSTYYSAPINYMLKYTYKF